MKRDIARHCKVFHSSAADKNLCGHLVTSGNPDDRPSKRRYIFAEQHNDAVQDIRNLVDDQNTTYWHSPHKHTYFDIVFDEKVYAKGYRMLSNLYDNTLSPTVWRFLGSDDGVTFTELDSRAYSGEERRFGDHIRYTYFTEEGVLPIDPHNGFRVFRLEILDNNGSENGVALGDFELISTDNRSLLKVFDGHFEQYWKSAGNGDEYLLLDLGAESRIDEVTLWWGDAYAQVYTLSVSDDGDTWRPCYTADSGRGGIERLTVNTHGRYMKLLMQQAVGDCYMLRRWCVFGDNDRTPPRSTWKLARAAEIDAAGETISSVAFDDTAWFPAVVPGTVLTAYMAAGAVHDYNDDDNYRQHSDAFFTTDWWYRTVLSVDPAQKGRRIWLHFDAVNRAADIFLNGQYLGNIQGAFLRKKIDITALVDFDGVNTLAVLVHCNAFPGQQKQVGLAFPEFVNGGATGLDEPCLAASMGWDWIATVSGRNVGIYKDVYLTYSDALQLIDPWIETKHIDFAVNDAALTFRTEIKNAAPRAVTGTLTCRIDGGAIEYTETVTLGPSSVCTITADDLLLKNARLWYPVGYGEPALYKAEVTLTVDGCVSDSVAFRFGVRTVEYPVENDTLSLSVNGKTVCCVGGNWGMDDATMRNNPRDYDIKVRLHADLHFNIIRNWVGQTNDTAFYEACDRYGVMVWEEFWLANPVDGPEPLEPAVFMANAEDKVKKVRRHPSVVLYCARNEGYATEPLATLLPALTQRLDPCRLFLPHSSLGLVSGFGPYDALEKEFYFRNTKKTIHSERGTPNIPTLESIQRFLSPARRWPINDTWTTHAFIVNGAQRCAKYCDRLRKIYGDFDSLESFVKKSQMLCYETFKAIFEAERAAEGGGMILWMSSPCMPSFAFQTYDYYYALNGGYMGAKLANQPLYAYFDPVASQLVLDNRSGRTTEAVTVDCRLFDLTGAPVWEETQTYAALDVGQRTIAPFCAGEDTVLLRTTVTAGGRVYRNFEWIYPQANASAGLEKLGDTALSVTLSDGTVTVKNVGDAPALMVALTLTDAATGERILPVFWSDNYLSLMPHEEQTVTFDLYDAAPAAVACRAEGYNTATYTAR